MAPELNGPNERSALRRSAQYLVGDGEVLFRALGAETRKRRRMWRRRKPANIIHEGKHETCSRRVGGSRGRRSTRRFVRDELSIWLQSRKDRVRRPDLRSGQRGRRLHEGTRAFLLLRRYTQQDVVAGTRLRPRLGRRHVLLADLGSRPCGAEPAGYGRPAHRHGGELQGSSRRLGSGPGAIVLDPAAPSCSGGAEPTSMP